MKKLIQKFKEDPSGIIVLTFIGVLWMFMQLSALQVFHNFYSCSCLQAGWGWNLTGLILSGASIIWGFMVGKDSPYVTKSDTGNVLILVLLVLFSFLTYMGFTTGYGCIQ